MFENDDYYKALESAIWHGRSKQNLNMRNQTRRNVQENSKKYLALEERPTLDKIKKLLLNLEGLYTDQNLGFNCMWELQHVREATIEAINKV